MYPYKPDWILYTLYRIAPETADQEIVLNAPLTYKLLVALTLEDARLSSTPLAPTAVILYEFTMSKIFVPYSIVPPLVYAKNAVVFTGTPVV
jgi:hypothetical protein